MKVAIKKINKYHDLQGFLMDFSASDSDVIDIGIYQYEYSSCWSMYISMRQAINRSKLDVKIHINADKIYIEKE